jgi:hypothetical protein
MGRAHDDETHQRHLEEGTNTRFVLTSRTE